MAWGYEDATEDLADAEAQRAWRERQGAANGHDPDWVAELLAPVDPSTLADIPVPPRRWLVPDWVPLARATALYGAGGEGKTLLAQMLATACAVGGQWLGLPVLRCNSLLHFCEDDLDEMQRRQEDINRAFGCAFADLGAMRWLPRLGDDNALMTFADGRPRHSRYLTNCSRPPKSRERSLSSPTHWPTFSAATKMIAARRALSHNRRSGGSPARRKDRLSRLRTPRAQA